MHSNLSSKKQKKKSIEEFIEEGKEKNDQNRFKSKVRVFGIEERTECRLGEKDFPFASAMISMEAFKTMIRIWFA